MFNLFSRTLPKNTKVPTINQNYAKYKQYGGFLKFKRFFSNSSKSQPKYYCSTIPNRSLFILQGPDLPKVLQGITTSNFDTFLKDKNKSGQHACFLNSKGKIISDAILIKPLTLKDHKLVPRSEMVWLDVSKWQAQELTAHIAKYSFKKKVEMIDITNGIKILNYYVRKKFLRIF